MLLFWVRKVLLVRRIGVRILRLGTFFETMDSDVLFEVKEVVLEVVGVIGGNRY